MKLCYSPDEEMFVETFSLGQAKAFFKRMGLPERFTREVPETEHGKVLCLRYKVFACRYEGKSGGARQ